MDMPVADASLIDADLEQKMQLAQKISSMALSLRKKVKIKVRQPLNKIMVPLLSPQFKEQVSAVDHLILSEVNVKHLEFLKDDSGIVSKSLKANFKALGPRYGKQMKKLAAGLAAFTPAQINELEKNGCFQLQLDGEMIEILLSDVEVITEDIPGWLIANDGALTVALDISLTDELIDEGIARDLVNRIQNLRKDKGFEVTDKINLIIAKDSEKINQAIENNYNYICSETLALSLEMVESINGQQSETIEIGDELQTMISIEKAG
jgi:isoleucyl-tRNA synthetase